jgi:hypothetical protein
VGAPTRPLFSLQFSGGARAPLLLPPLPTMPILPSVEWLCKQGLRMLVQRHLGPLLRSEVCCENEREGGSGRGVGASAARKKKRNEWPAHALTLATTSTTARTNLLKP